MQIYFAGNFEDEIDQRCALNNAFRCKIVGELQETLLEHNKLVGPVARWLAASAVDLMMQVGQGFDSRCNHLGVFCVCSALPSRS